MNINIFESLEYSQNLQEFEAASDQLIQKASGVIADFVQSNHVSNDLFKLMGLRLRELGQVMITRKFADSGYKNIHNQEEDLKQKSLADNILDRKRNF